MRHVNKARSNGDNGGNRGMPSRGHNLGRHDNENFQGTKDGS